MGDLGYARFLPWHRAYLIMFERELQSLDSSLSIPYWDWVADDGQMYGFENWSGKAKRRLPQNRKPWDVTEDAIKEVLSHTDYMGFAKALEELHDKVHVWVGGHMATGRSPTDPAFWFHHAQVDRIWAIWQDAHPHIPAHIAMQPFGTDAARLDPFGFTVEEMRTTSAIKCHSYEYVEPTPA